MAHDVFISYAHEDRTVANAIVATLEVHGIRCWIAPRDILPGVDWGEAIIDAIKEAHAMIMVFSSHSNESDQIKREVERGVHQGIAVIPFRIEDVLPSKTLEFFISTQHWLDAMTPPLEKHLAHLTDTVTVLLAKKKGKAKPPEGDSDEPAPVKAGKWSEVKPPQEPSPVNKDRGSSGKFPLIWVAPLVGLFVVLVVAGVIWLRWPQPGVTTPTVPTPSSPASPLLPEPQQPLNHAATPPVSWQEGKFVIAPGPDRWRMVINQDMILPNNMEVSVTVSFLKVASPEFGSGIVFWAKDYGEYYALLINPQGLYAVHRHIMDRNLLLVDWRESDAIKKGEGADNILKMVTEGNQATVFINGKNIITFNGQPPKGGSMIGVKVFCGPQGANTVAFANLRVVVGPSQVMGFKMDPIQPDRFTLFPIR